MNIMSQNQVTSNRSLDKVPAAAHVNSVVSSCGKLGLGGCPETCLVLDIIEEMEYYEYC